MVVRVSEGRFLEILESAPALAVPIELDVFEPDGATMLATLESAWDKRFSRELSETGGGGFALARNDPKAVNIVEGNLVKFRVGGIHRHAAWIEERAKTLVSADEEAGERWVVEARGALAMLEQAEVYPPVWPPAAAVYVNASSAGGAVTILSIPKPAGAISGDVAIVGIASLGAAPATPSGWKRIRNTTNGSLRLLLYRRRLVASEPATWKFIWSVATSVTGASVVLRNASPDDTAWGIDDTTGSGTSVQAPGQSIGVVDGYLLSFAAVAADTAVSPPAGMTERVDDGRTGRTIEIATLANPALGDTGDLVSTAGASAAWIALSLFVPSTLVNDVVFEGATFGAVLATLIDEAQARGVIPALTYDFTGDVDSHGEPWADVHDLAFHAGTNLLEVWRHLVTLGLEGWMTPGLRLQAFNDASRHFEATVILRKGHQLVGEVVDTSHGTGRRTRMLIEGAGGRVIEVTDPVLEADPHVGRREGYLEVSTSDNPTTLQRAGEIALEISALEDEARSIAVAHGTAAEGQYEPFTDYREGDWIGMDADGSGGEATAERVWTIALTETVAGDYATELELNSPEMDRESRLYRRLNSLTRDTTASGSGGSGGGSGTSGGRVGVSATDTPGWLGDKLTVDATLTKTLVGDIGAQRVKLAVAPGGTHPDLATHDALGLATDAELAGLAVTAAAADAAHVAATDPHVGYQRESEKDQPSGYAGLGVDGLVPVAELPFIEGLITAETDATLVLAPDGAGGVEFRAETGGSGGALTVEEVDGSPTDAAVSKIVFPNGTLGIAGHVATYTPSGVGGGGTTPTLVGTATAEGASPLVITKPAGTTDGDLLLWVGMFTNSIPQAAGPNGAGWTSVLYFDTSSNEFQVIWYRVASSEGASWSMTHSAGTDTAAGVVVLRGASTLWSSGFSEDRLDTPPIIGDPAGCQVCVWMSTTGAANDLTLPAHLTSALFKRNLTSTNHPQLLVGYRASGTDGAVPAFVAGGGVVQYNGAVAMVFKP